MDNKMLKIVDQYPVHYILLANVIICILWKLIAFFENDSYGVFTLISLGLFLVCCCLSFYKVCRFIEIKIYGDKSQKQETDIQQNVEEINKSQETE